MNPMHHLISVLLLSSAIIIQRLTISKLRKKIKELEADAAKKLEDGASAGLEDS